MMIAKKSLLFTWGLLLLAFTFTAPAAQATKPGGEYDAIVSHLKSKYQAKKVHIPFMFLARFAVKVAKPAGVKSFNITLFNDLKFSKETLDLEMQEAMRRSFGPEWSSVFHVRSRDGQQAYMYVKEDGKNVRVTVVSVDKEEAAVIRATFSPEKLAEFINDPKIFGISLNDDDKKSNKHINKPKDEAKPVTENDR
ncbi:MAG: hypothetical protein ABJB40_08685 [Acidobacteriota bacterium]